MLQLRDTILARLLDSFNQIRSSRVCSCSLWIIGEYATSQEDIEAALEVRLRGERGRRRVLCGCCRVTA